MPMGMIYNIANRNLVQKKGHCSYAFNKTEMLIAIVTWVTSFLYKEPNVSYTL